MSATFIYTLLQWYIAGSYGFSITPVTEQIDMSLVFKDGQSAATMTTYIDPKDPSNTSYIWYGIGDQIDIFTANFTTYANQYNQLNSLPFSTNTVPVGNLCTSPLSGDKFMCRWTFGSGYDAYLQCKIYFIQSNTWSDVITIQKISTGGYQPQISGVICFEDAYFIAVFEVELGYEYSLFDLNGNVIQNKTNLESHIPKGLKPYEDGNWYVQQGLNGTILMVMTLWDGEDMYNVPQYLASYTYTNINDTAPIQWRITSQISNYTQYAINSFDWGTTMIPFSEDCCYLTTYDYTLDFPYDIYGILTDIDGNLMNINGTYENQLLIHDSFLGEYQVIYFGNHSTSDTKYFMILYGAKRTDQSYPEAPDTFVGKLYTLKSDPDNSTNYMLTEMEGEYDTMQREGQIFCAWSYSIPPNTDYLMLSFVFTPLPPHPTEYSTWAQTWQFQWD